MRGGLPDLGWMQDVDVERVWSGLLATCSSTPARDATAGFVGRAAKMDEDMEGGDISPWLSMLVR